MNDININTHEFPNLLCEVCKKFESLYRCPKCSVKTCSLICVKNHKLEFECDGKHYQINYLPIKNFTDKTLLTDYKFLEAVNNRLESSNRNHYLHMTDLPKRVQLMKQFARSQKIFLRIMSYGMSRHTENTTIFDMRTKSFLWHIKCVFPSIKACYHQKRICERIRVEQVLQDVLDACFKENTNINIHKMGYNCENIDISADQNDNVRNSNYNNYINSNKNTNNENTNYNNKNDNNNNNNNNNDNTINNLNESSKTNSYNMANNELKDDSNNLLEKVNFENQNRNLSYFSKNVDDYYVYMKNECRQTGHTKKWLVINPKETLRNNLYKKVILEYPIFHFVHRDEPRLHQAVYDPLGERFVTSIPSESKVKTTDCRPLESKIESSDPIPKNALVFEPLDI